MVPERNSPVSYSLCVLRTTQEAGKRRERQKKTLKGRCGTKGDKWDITREVGLGEKRRESTDVTDEAEKGNGRRRKARTREKAQRKGMTAKREREKKKKEKEKKEKPE